MSAYAHDEHGEPTVGSAHDLASLAAHGCQLKVGVTGLCAELAPEVQTEHEVFVNAGPCYHYTRQGLFMVGSHPLVRVKPAIPLRYETEGWDCGWLMLRTDGHVAYRCCDPYTLKFEDRELRLALRWFVR